MDTNTQGKIRVIFPEKANLAVLDILKNYQIPEEDASISHGKETGRSILRDAAKAMAKDIISSEKLAEFLEKHLQTSPENAQKITGDIKSKVLPLLVVAPDEKFNDPAFREEISKKVFENEEIPTNKKVDELLEKIKSHEKIPAANNNPPTPIVPSPSPKKVLPPINTIKTKEQKEPPQETKPDPYKEPIE